MKSLAFTILLATALLSGVSHAQSKTINTVTFTGTLTLVGTPSVTNNGTVEKTTQSLTSYRLGNREILQLMADNGVIPTITGYSLVQKFQNDGTPIGYFARSTTGAEVAADPSIFGFTTVASVLSSNTTITQPATPGGPVTTTGTITGKVHGILSVSGTNCTLIDSITRTIGRTAKLNDVTVTFAGVVGKAKLIGSFGSTGPAIDATLDSKTTKPISDP